MGNGCGIVGDDQHGALQRLRAKPRSPARWRDAVREVARSPSTATVDELGRMMHRRLLDHQDLTASWWPLLRLLERRRDALLLWSLARAGAGPTDSVAHLVLSVGPSFGVRRNDGQSPLPEPPVSNPRARDVTSQLIDRFHVSDEWRRFDRDPALDGEIAICIDEAFVLPAAVFVSSVAPCLPARWGLLCVFRGEAPPWFIELCRDVSGGKFAFHHAADAEGGSMLPHVSYAALDRLSVIELTRAPRVIYFDVDLVVLHPIDELLSGDRGNAPLRARLVDPFQHDARAELLHEPSRRRVIKDEIDREYRLIIDDLLADQPGSVFNAGVLDLRVTDETRRLMRLAYRLATRFGLHDQEALNIAFCGAAEWLNGSWNVFAHECLEDVNAVGDRTTHIIHWVGPLKGWHGAGLPGEAEWRDDAISLVGRLPLEVRSNLVRNCLGFSSRQL